MESKFTILEYKIEKLCTDLYVSVQQESDDNDRSGSDDIQDRITVLQQALNRARPS